MNQHQTQDNQKGVRLLSKLQPWVLWCIVIEPHQISRIELHHTVQVPADASKVAIPGDVYLTQFFHICCCLKVVVQEKGE